MSEAMNIIIAGSRDFDDYRLLKKTVSDYIEENQVNNTQQIRVISGGAKGADRLGECYAFDNGYSVIRFQALWGVYGKSAGPRRNNENDITPDWGRYLLQNVDRYIYKNPDVMIYGNDDSRSGWFDKKDLKNTTELIINREELPISGTMLRALMIQDKRREWMTFVNPKLHKMYDEIRSELMESIKEN